MTFLYHEFIFYPLYNAFIFLIGTFPFLDAGLAIIVFTIIVRLLLYPLASKSVRTQAIMRTMNPEIEALKEKYKDDKEKQAKETMALYKKYNLNPFASILLIFIQLPILIGLYRVFLASGLPHVNASILYPFVSASVSINMIFLGIIDITAKNYILAFCAGITQYFQAKLMVPPPSKGPKKSTPDFAYHMSMQMKYVLPIVIFFIAYTTKGAVAIYLTVSNLFMIGQELFMRRKLAREEQMIIEAEAPRA